jgi:hypothetical protein
MCDPTIFKKLKLMRAISLVVLITGLSLSMLISFDTQAQTPNDGFTMSKGEICLVTDYGQSTWKEYWEGTRLRENLNLGTFTSKMIMPMAGYGLNDRLNLFAGLPYISTSSSAGQMTGMKGWQDLSIAAKYKLIKKKKEHGTFYTFLSAGFSFPISDYVPDFLPYSIGLGAKALNGRVIAHYEHKSKFFATAQTGYTLKSNITTDRQSYYNEGQVNSNEMPVPDVWDGALRVGYNNKRVRVDMHYNWSTSTTGSDIRQNDMPMPYNKMDAQWVGISGLLWIPGIKGLAVHAMADQVIAGRNVGKAFSWSAGVQYVFNPFKKSAQ